MIRYRKKPVVIDAILSKDAIKSASQDWKSLPNWLAEAYEKGGIVFFPKGVSINTLEGTMTACPEDYILCGVKGEIYPCKPEIFLATYDRVDVDPVSCEVRVCLPKSEESKGRAISTSGVGA